MAAEHTEDAHPPGSRPSGLRTHIAVALLLAVFTVAAFGAVGGNLLPKAVLLPLIGVLAVAQVGLQAAFYMHLRWDRRLFTLVFVSAALLAVFIGWTAWYLLTVRPGRT